MSKIRCTRPGGSPSEISTSRTLAGAIRLARKWAKVFAKASGGSVRETLGGADVVRGGRVTHSWRASK